MNSQGYSASDKQSFHSMCVFVFVMCCCVLLFSGLCRSSGLFPGSILAPRGVLHTVSNKKTLGVDGSPTLHMHPAETLGTHIARCWGSIATLLLNTYFLFSREPRSCMNARCGPTATTYYQLPVVQLQAFAPQAYGAHTIIKLWEAKRETRNDSIIQTKR